MNKKKFFKRLAVAHTKLDSLYKKIPKTKGCLENISLPKESGGCGSWCCELQSPSVLQVEFLKTWNHVVKNWSKEKIADLVELSIRSYLSNSTSKGCVFWDKESKLCKQHETRPYNCRVYGITPKEEFEKRLVRLKVINPNASYCNQCPLVSTVKGEKVYVSDTEKWWKSLVELEKSIGVEEKYINDDVGGSYRMYHDHIVLRVCNDSIMSNLQTLRVHGTEIEKEIAVAAIVGPFRKKLLSEVKDE